MGTPFGKESEGSAVTYYIRFSVKKILALGTIIALLVAIIPNQVRGEQVPKLVVMSNFDRDTFRTYKSETGYRIDSEVSGDIEHEIATAYAVRDDRVDV